LKLRNYRGWKNNSNGKIVQYDFSPPRSWSGERIREEMKLVTQALRSIENVENQKCETGWQSLARQLPKELRMALISELELGNTMTGIGRSGWPNDESIVVNVSDRIHLASQRISPQVHWRRLDDLHYCREELSQKYCDVDYMIVT
jgi:hypothetical protein